MQTINKYILEKLVINKTSKPNFDIDDMSEGIDMDLYDETEFEADYEGQEEWDDCNRELEAINDKYTGFIVTQWYSLGDKYHKKINEDAIYIANDDLDYITNKIISGRDYGYAVRLKGGHLEIDCINSGSRGRYYIYALTKEGWDITYNYIHGYDDTYDDLDFFLEDVEHKYIEPIILK